MTTYDPNDPRQQQQANQDDEGEAVDTGRQDAAGEIVEDEDPQQPQPLGEDTSGEPSQ